MRVCARSATFASTNKSLRPKLCVLFLIAFFVEPREGDGRLMCFRLHKTEGKPTDQTGGTAPPAPVTGRADKGKVQ